MRWEEGDKGEERFFSLKYLGEIKKDQQRQKFCIRKEKTESLCPPAPHLKLSKGESGDWAWRSRRAHCQGPLRSPGCLGQSWVRLRQEGNLEGEGLHGTG